MTTKGLQACNHLTW
jgi:hypothetical protein